MSDGPRTPPHFDELESSDPAPDLPADRPASIDLSRPTWLRVLSLAWPVYVQQMLLMLVNVYDLYLAGNNPPTDESLHVHYQAAQTTAIYLSWFLATLAYLVSVGATALVARFVGARDYRLAIRTTHQALLLALIIGTVFSIVGLLFLDSLIGLLGLHGEAADMAVRFLEPILWLMTFQVICTTGLACLVGAGDTRMTLWVLGGVAFVNVPISWGLLHGAGPLPEMGFPGITMGTALSHALGAVAVLVVLARGRAGLRLRLSLFRPAWDLIRRLLRVSVPAFADSCSLGIFQLWFLSLVNGLGDTAAAAHGIAIRWEALGYLSGAAFGTAASALVGQHLGADEPHEARRAGWTSLALGAALMSLMGMIFFLLAVPMFRLFCPYEHQQPIIDAGVPVLRLVAFAMPPLAAAIIFTHALRGAGDTRWPVVFTWIGFLVVRLPLAYFLTRDQVHLGALGTLPGWNLGLFGAWIAMLIDLFVRGGLFLSRFASGHWQRVKV